MDEGLLLIRLVFGLVIAAHGAQKLFAWFGGYGLDGTGQFLEGLGFRPGRLFAQLAGASEFGGGLLFALGLFGPLGSMLILAVMITAAVSVHWQGGLFATSNGFELPLVYATGAVAVALTGPGRYSVDALFGLTSLWSPALVWLALVLGIAGAFGNLALRRVPGGKAVGV